MVGEHGPDPESIRYPDANDAFRDPQSLNHGFRAKDFAVIRRSRESGDQKRRHGVSGESGESRSEDAGGEGRDGARGYGVG